jgi:hypothetical protein
MTENNYLFSNVEWFSVDQHQRKRIIDEIADLDGDRLLNTSVDDLCDYFEKNYRIDVPALRRDEIIADQRETQIDVSGDSHRFISDRDQPFFITGTAIEVSIPFDGDAEAFKIQPSMFTLNPPSGKVQSGELVLRIVGTDLTPEQVRNEIDRTLVHIENCLTNLRTNVQDLNNSIATIARNAIEQRRQKLLGDRSLVSSLGFKMKERHGAPRTYVAPEVRRKLSRALPTASTTPYKPEPTLSVHDYEHILGVIENMAKVMELSPSAFVSMDEESLRSHFLVQLNGHYEGQATGETFNYDGKTDILIRSDGRNIFIAECKYWGGAKKLLETLDQLLGYSSWRDTKVAVIVFNRNKDFSKVLKIIQETTKIHPNCKRDLGPQSESSFRYIFSHRDDAGREMMLTVLAFDVPS